MTFIPDSHLMKMFRLLGMPRFATAARRLHCPVPKDALVLEVGSGNNPYPRSDVLLDASLNDYERGGRLIADRPLVIGLAERLPFKDHIFDFSIASHVLEHSSDPGTFLFELQRVSKAGYIETPDIILELLEPVRCHRLLVTQKESCLVINKKTSWNPHTSFAEAWSSLRERSAATRSFIKRYEGEMLLRFYWSGVIQFVVQNSDTDCAWPVPHPELLRDRRPVEELFRSSARRLIHWFAKRRRKKVMLLNLLLCVDCRGERLKITDSLLICEECGREYKVKNGIPVMMPTGWSWD
jgi:uncharacterized protein YbaR (Trm112 family)